MKDMTNFNLKYLRIKNGYTVTKLSKELKIDPSTVTKWESNQRNITLENALIISNFFGINIEDFILKDLSKNDIQTEIISREEFFKEVDDLLIKTNNLKDNEKQMIKNTLEFLKNND